jgi:PKD domain-containing protein
MKWSPRTVNSEIRPASLKLRSSFDIVPGSASTNRLACGYGYDLGCAPHAFVWDFGDGQRATGSQGTHVFARSGTYEVMLTMANCVSWISSGKTRPSSIRGDEQRGSLLHSLADFLEVHRLHGHACCDRVGIAAGGPPEGAHRRIERGAKFADVNGLYDR